MAIDDERREVAERLRDVARAEGWPLGDIGFTEAMHRALGGDGWRDMTERLADLIDPGESGQNLDKNRDTVQIESPAVQKAPECDREALLELAEDVTYSAAVATVMDASKSAKMLADMLLDIARRIREACGEVVE